MSDRIRECEDILVKHNAEAVPSRVHGQTVFIVASPKELPVGVRSKVVDLIPYPVKFIVCVKCGTITTLRELLTQSMIPTVDIKGDESLLIELKSGEYQPEDKTTYARTLGQAISRLLEMDGYPTSWKVVLDGGIIAQK